MLEPSKNLNLGVESYTKHRIECSVCGEVDTIDDSDWSPGRREAISVFVGRGWRRAMSDKYGLIGVICPSCLELGDY